MSDLLDVLSKLWPIVVILLGIVVSLVLPDKHIKEFDPQPEPPGKSKTEKKKTK